MAFLWRQTKEISFTENCLFTKKIILTQNHKILPFFSDIPYSVYLGEGAVQLSWNKWQWSWSTRRLDSCSCSVSFCLSKQMISFLPCYVLESPRVKNGVSTYSTYLTECFITSINLYWAPTSHVWGSLLGLCQHLQLPGQWRGEGSGTEVLMPSLRTVSSQATIQALVPYSPCPVLLILAFS